jgi:hypothetical protein
MRDDIDDLMAAYNDRSGKYKINREVDYIPTDMYFQDYVIDELVTFHEIQDNPNVVELFNQHGRLKDKLKDK